MHLASVDGGAEPAGGGSEGVCHDLDGLAGVLVVVVGADGRVLGGPAEGIAIEVVDQGLQCVWIESN